MAKLRVLHLSDTTLSGSPIRIVDLINKHSEKFEARHLVWNPTTGFRTFQTDLIGTDMDASQLHHWVHAYPDIIHFHNRWQRQEVFKVVRMPERPSVIQIHSPRFGQERFEAEANSGVPIAIIAQQHPAQWPEASYVVPNVVDITSPEYLRATPPLRTIPVVSYAPSNVVCKGMDNKGYNLVMPTLKRLKFANKIYLQLITQKPHNQVMELKRGADIGIDEIVTGGFHLSSLEYLALGVPCFANLDKATTDVVKKVTGCVGKLPWLKATPESFERELCKIIAAKSWQELGRKSREWMSKYWSPQALLPHYESMYADLLEKQA